MATRMLIDARHPEETRVAVLKGNRIEEFDFESAEHRQIKGNIYLAKVTRVEPSLQAAFVDFGGNRHGFLAFSEIHPDYYQIPKEDREALLAEEAKHAEEEARLRAEEDDEDGVADPEEDLDEEGNGVEEIDTSEKDEVATIEGGHVENDDEEEGEVTENADVEAEDADRADANDDEYANDGGEEEESSSRHQGRRGRGRRQGGGNRARAKEMDDLRSRRMALRRRYKIQDVIQRRQVLLVQVVKEERGNKGAALTTYLSLAGRYTVLMPNSSHGGGISRKISNVGDRKRLKEIVSDLTLPKAMGLIVRTAGLSRNKTEIKRDFDYLARLWDEIRERTLKSSAPAMIHSDSDLIKRAIRDIYHRDIEEVVVEGEEGFKSAKTFMKLLMPSHARRVKQYADPVPLFQRYGAEDQLSAMYDPMVQLKSGGYLVINPTEALVSIDINSGRSTREHGIEQTATATNIEAAEEIARQLRLRDMAGLVVIDFIDMEYNSNIRKVEKAMKNALKNDRARIQVGRISGFGLMEMSRQRLRTGVLEATTRSCPHCDGTGLVRTASSAGLSALRLIEDEAAKAKGSTITLYASTEAAIYLLNAKRSDLATIEELYGVTVEVVPEGEEEGAKMRVASSGPRPSSKPTFEPIIIEDEDDEDIPEEDDLDEEDGLDEEGEKPRKRRRRRGGRGRKKNREDGAEESEASEEGETRGEREAATHGESSDEEGKPRKRRRGGRGRRKRGDGDAIGEKAAEDVAEMVGEQLDEDISVVAGHEETEKSAEEEKPKRKRASRAKKKAEPSGVADEATQSPEPKAEAKPKRSRSKPKAEPAEAEGEDPKPNAEPTQVEGEAPKPKARSRKKAIPKTGEPAEAAQKAGEPVVTHEAGAKERAEPEPANGGGARRGWWQRTFGE